ncbi:binding-protein-dependent transport system inner membrane protein [Marinobacter santoriniensis NKSG1]|uniref:Binding-protein-dependent transport system inner membrane protein n=1 Tax=Marinobacter santoriniensis NKSG1 TaxID=1288826 RepID=M7CTD6_9GAMM|nr:binding-protein-dependent transport system inner membrane protein [Marinobacter santoriniensis]EMP55405.1 binding-protein-dependent transport system inner membrane protein [Marinobacter santoriniensis NKSG1]
MFSYPTVRTSFIFVAIALVGLLFSDIAITSSNPWQDLANFFLGVVTPNFFSSEGLMTALLRTVAFAFVGVAVGSASGFLLALVYRFLPVRIFCNFIRAIHELFWALIFLQFFGFHPLTGVLAIAIPYAGIFAKVYSEILDEADPGPRNLLPSGTGVISAFLFARIPDCWHQIRTYTAYRLECGLRSSAILGFVGLPTLGFYLEASFSQGLYSDAGAMLILFYVLIATIPIWVRPKLLPIYVLSAPFFLGEGLPIVWGNVARFFTQDIVPAPLRNGEGLAGLVPWLNDLMVNAALPGIWNTVILTQIALVATGMLALLAFPLVSNHFGGPVRRTFGHVFLVIARSTPEYVLAYILLQLWGPSMLPAVVALALHNGGIIGHLIGRQTNGIRLRPDAPKGFNRYTWELTPRIYRSFLAFLFYRWEIIMRETAILGILGIYTLGFYVDSAIQNIHFDRALVLILITALLNIGIDTLGRYIRRKLALQTMPTC